MKTGHNILLALLVIVVLVLFFLLAFGNRGLVDVYRLKQELARMEEKNQQLEKENAELRRNIDRLLHDPKYVESVAREELGMVGKDEIIYNFESKDKKPETR